MNKKSASYNGAVMNASELDPCLAAESRLKQNLLSDRVKGIFFLLLAVVFVLACLGLLFLFMGNTGDMDENYDDAIIVEEEEAGDREELDSEGTLYGKNNMQKSSITHSSEEKGPRVFFTPPPTTASPPPSTTVRVPYLIPIDEGITTTETIYTPSPLDIAASSPPPPSTAPRVPYLIPIDGEITTQEAILSSTESSRIAISSASSTPSTITTTTTEEPTTSSMTTTTARPRTPAYYRKTTSFGQPTVSVSIWNSLQEQPTNVPVTDETEESCLAHREYGLGSGIYKLNPDGLEPFYAFCDMETDGGGWTVIQRRLDGQEDFHNKYYKHYEVGFGNLRGNHWLGLQYVHRMAPLDQDPQILRVELRGDTCSAPGCSRQADAGFWWGEWDFSLGSHFTQYTLSISDFQLRGNMTNPTANKRNTRWEAMSNGMKFTSLDQDNDESQTINCAQFRSFGGWWHRDCTVLSLNGKYGDRHSQLRYLTYYRDGAESTYYIKPRQTLMMIRPRL